MLEPGTPPHPSGAACSRGEPRKGAVQLWSTAILPLAAADHGRHCSAAQRLPSLQHKHGVFVINVSVQAIVSRYLGLLLQYRQCAAHGGQCTSCLHFKRKLMELSRRSLRLQRLHRQQHAPDFVEQCWQPCTESCRRKSAASIAWAKGHSL